MPNKIVYFIVSFQELNRTNRQMQQRLVDLLDKIANEEVTSKLLLYQSYFPGYNFYINLTCNLSQLGL